jgi:hypothetical protein
MTAQPSRQQTAWTNPSPRRAPGGGSGKAPAAPPPWGTPGNGSAGTYSPAGGGKGAGRKDHPAMRYGEVANPAGHVRYCAGIIADAKTARGAITEQTGAFNDSVKKADKDQIPWSVKRLIMLRMKRADRRLGAAYEAVAKQAAKKAKARQDADAYVVAQQAKKKRTTRRAGAYTPHN